MCSFTQIDERGHVREYSWDRGGVPILDLDGVVFMVENHQWLESVQEYIQEMRYIADFLGAVIVAD